jgi:hypothetical protein
MATFNFYAHRQLCLEQAKVAIAYGVVSRNEWKTKVMLITTGLPRSIEWFRLIAASVAFATTLVACTNCELMSEL